MLFLKNRNPNFKILVFTNWNRNREALRFQPPIATNLHASLAKSALLRKKKEMTDVFFPEDFFIRGVVTALFNFVSSFLRTPMRGVDETFLTIVSDAYLSGGGTRDRQPPPSIFQWRFWKRRSKNFKELIN